jgi:hypothetical protein
VGSGDLGHEVPAGQLGQHVSVDLVRLGGQGCQTLCFHRIGDGHLPAQALEGVVDEARARHRLYDSVDLLAVAQDAISEGTQDIRVRTDGHYLDRSSFLVENVHIEPLARQAPIRRTTLRGASRCWWL